MGVRGQITRDRVQMPGDKEQRLETGTGRETRNRALRLGQGPGDKEQRDVRQMTEEGRQGEER
jgi:hypothetical protein